MSLLTQNGRQVVNQLAQKYGISTAAVEQMLDAVNRGNGSMAQFNIPELGGMGQWMRGGMTMVGDMFNNQLKYTVDSLCEELTQALNSSQIYQPAPTPTMGGNPAQAGNTWWPSEWGMPSSAGGQGVFQYAYFPGVSRLAVKHDNQVILYDTEDHQIGGFQQQNDRELMFQSQKGSFLISSLKRV